VSLTDALRAGAPQAFGALYDEYAGALYAYCHVMVGDEAGDALRDVFVMVARHPDAAPGDDAELPVWLHSLARAECVRRGALVRGVVTTRSADPLRHALALLSPEHREVLALSNALDPKETAQVLGVARDTAETLVREAQRRLEQAAASVGGQETQDSAMLASLNGEALHRLVTLGHEPSGGQREWVLSSCAAAGRAHNGAAVFDADGTPLPQDALSAQADDATHQFPRISPDEPPTAPLRQVDGISAGTRPDQSGPGESGPGESGPAELGLAEGVPVGFGSVGWESMGAGSAEDPNANTGEQPPRAGGTHAKQRKPFLSRRFLPVVGLVACVAAATGTALAWPTSHHANETSSLVRQSVRPSRSAQPTPSGDQASPPPQAATSSPSASPTPTPTRTAAAPTAAPRPSSTAPAEGSDSATPTPPTEPTPPAQPTPPAEPTPPTTHPSPPTTRPKPHHTPSPGDEPADGHRTIGPRRPDRACHGTPGRASRCARPHPWRSVVRPRS
jgi:DNA-directed RNA polymerase specialized sigma24 family protein